MGFAQMMGATHVMTNLISENNQLVKGEDQKNYIGLYAEIEDHWHMYWRNPGDSGLELRINWDAPDGVEIGEIIWPTPEIIPFQGLVNYGHEGEQLFAIPVTIPEDFKGDEITLKAEATWLVCRESCVPESDSYELTLPVIGGEASPSVNKVLFDQAKEKWPIAYDRPTFFEYDEQGNFVLELSHFDNDNLQAAHFFPYEWGVINYAATQSWSIENQEDQGDVLKLRAASDHQWDKKALEGVLKLEFEQASLSYMVRAVNENFDEAGAVTPSKDESLSQEKASFDNNEALDEGELPPLYEILLYAFLGGLILNLMPCVFPVLFIKAMSLINHANDPKVDLKKNGLFYMLGVVISFVAIGGLFVGLRALGENIGWGFQLQSPVIVTVFSVLFFLIAMNMAGFFEFGGSIMRFGGRFSIKEGYGGSFLTGVLAVIVATPCTVPYMAPALGSTIFLPPFLSLVVFATLGLGLAFPYLVLSSSPKLIQYLPRPGAWMESFKQFLTFPMLISAAWLYFVLVGQSSPYAAIAAFAIGILFLFFFWVLGRQDIFSEKTKLIWSVLGLILLFFVLSKKQIILPMCTDCVLGSLGTAILVVLILGVPLVFWRNMVSVIWLVIAALFSYHILVTYIQPVDHSDNHLAQNMAVMEQQISKNYVAYDKDKLANLIAEDKKVFVNMTADWCITCLANEKATLSQEDVKQAFKDNDVIYMKGDWTDYDQDITNFLKKYRRSGVPLYIYYHGDKEPVILPQILTQETVIDTISK